MTDIRRVEYRLPDGNIMVLRIGQKLKAGNFDFEISHFRRVKEPGAILTQVFVKAPNKRPRALWKEITNGVEIIEYNVTFLCEV